MLGNAIGTLHHYLFVYFPRAETFTCTDYFKEIQLRPQEERKKLLEDRFAGYKAICMFGLGSLFWAVATDVLPDWKDRTGWIEYIYIHAIVTSILQLNGLVASTFQSTAWFAPCVAGLGGWSSLILFLGTAHLISLKFHSYVKECFESLLVSSAVVTIYWAVSVQDPLPLYILVKTILWAVGLLIYGTGYVLYTLCGCIFWCMKWVSLFIWGVSLFIWGFVWSDQNSMRHRVIRACARDSYAPLPRDPRI